MEVKIDMAEEVERDSVERMIAQKQSTLAD